jgi:hypothetical protein
MGNDARLVVLGI